MESDKGLETLCGIRAGLAVSGGKRGPEKQAIVICWWPILPPDVLHG